MVYLTLGEIIEGLFPADDLFPQNVLYPREERVGAILTKSVYTHAEYEDYTVQSISGIRMYNSKNELIASYKTATNVYNITDNILADGISSADALTILQNLYSQIGNIWYMPCSVECIGNPCIEAGDSVQLATTDRVIYMFVMERTLKGIQALKDTYESHGDEYRIDEMDSIANKVKAVTAKADDAYNYADTANRNAGTAQGRADSAYSYAGTANTNAGKAQTRANEAYNLAATKVTAQEVDTKILNAGFAKISDLNATNARINSLSATVATINNAYITRATCQSIASQTVNSYFASLSALIVQGNITCGSISMGGVTMGKQQRNFRMSDGSTRLITYIGT